ncbi:hypothetical protein EN828_10510 [Mesorhizobium sp. M2D.F.Ca.ET.185.01.1.1]|uniref:hypothetical protein n=1 Tax=unclassified Mesorhizobium TaxID=325217 RepID=UPI000FCB3811|nr:MULTISPECIES: hypothetical protein [unclassified Mesorhizobium]TGT97817.1 hypothetical protein EN806_48420 [bacterium M00.F.Ca.ET.163.01.1.1]TGV81415.1 hypothetical protein EN792_034755 [Mesorhizobium sp. M00.F.Ca.ET.149.01.1.1]TGP25905.1 hypothetical protein EN875_034410 [Mesorhizobium sp. M2D.F.Ca.ET.232.01.1.1]TGQ23827.1 hypothetical protein EN863_064855 [Mesorhizobium sp. M00.F.Ca.ET.220.01.1.1]TGQ89468.1 hypothetical protein EN849_10010 [Mesorhizobium sp. M2D.F.Ca.ET.206.01.1.1]
MFGIFGFVLNWLTSGPLDRILSSIDKHGSDITEREKIKSEAVSQYVAAQVQIANSRQWWFPILFLVPAGLWFGAVCLYSIFWCAKCAYPRAWSIAALPPPLDQWEGWIVSSLFIGKAGEAIIGKFRK